MVIKIIVEDYKGNDIAQTTSSKTFEELLNLKMGNFSLADEEDDESQYIRIQYDYEGIVPEKELETLKKIIN